MLGSLDHNIMLGFVEEAKSYVPTIRQGIIAFQADSAKREDIQIAYRQIHTIKGAALMVGLAELSDLAGNVENVLEELEGGTGTLSAESAQSLLTQLDEVEGLLDASIGELRELAQNTEADGQNVDFQFEGADQELYGAATDGFNGFEEAAAATGETTKVNSSEFELLDEDVDPEMLEIFALEAEEHLQTISANLQTLEQNPQHKEALQNIRRSSHTLKGAAGVVGFKTTSQLAHRMEDLLDHLAEKPFDSTPQTTALLLASTELLESLSRGQSAESLRIELENLYSRYETMLNGGLADFGAPKTVSENIVETVETPEFIVDTFVADAHEQAALADAAEPMPQNAEAVRAALVEAEPEIQTATPPRTTVRVGLERLDEMVKLMGEMIINRTVLEQRLKEIEIQVNEMHLSTSRLRRIAGKLEIDFEASALGGYRGSSSNFVPMFLAASALVSNDSPENQETENANKHGFDELEFDRYTEFHQLTRELVETSSDTTSITHDLNELLSDFDGLLTRQRRHADELQEKLMRLRMVSLDTLVTRLGRTVRVTADKENKLVDLEIEGGEVEIDTQVLNSLTEPLLHLLRNAVVHGVELPEERQKSEKSERGTINLQAKYEGTQIVLSVTDDGRGIDTVALREKAVRENLISETEAGLLSEEQALSLIFLSGFSTAQQINEFAGRGVGMDVVRESVLRQQGSVSLKSQAGHGTTIQIRLPMSLAVTRALIVKAYGERFAIPLSTILHLSQVRVEDIDQLTQEKILWINSKFYPVHALNELLNLPPLAERDETQIPTLLIQTGENAVALTLDEVMEAREVVIKPLANPLKNLRGLLGATILGDGSVVPVLDMTALIERQNDKQLAAIAERISRQTIKPEKTTLSVMIVDDSPSVRRVMSNLITKNNWNVLVAKDGLEAVEMLQVARELPDVILSDVEMPRMDGYELLATLKRQESFSQIPVVMITSRAGEKHQQRALELGASEYVVKPYQDSVLIDTIKQLTNVSVA